tara:strand:- start:172 stop:1470 length:1299 start_codon:yes stop_codon:yes gene_type:complete
MKRKYSFFYGYMQFWVSLALRIFFKNIIVHYKEQLPKDKPLIYCGNHQNAFLDAMLIAVVTNTQPYSLVRADIFKKKFAAWLLGTLKMMPVFRIRDGRDSMNNNDEIFQRCYDLLSRGETIIIFPEGNHGEEQRLRPLKKGAARIAFGAELQNDFNLELQIVPIGLNYNHYSKFRSNVIINFGKPISAKDYRESLQKDENEATRSITNELAKRMREEMLDISVGTYYEKASTFIHNLHPCLHKHPKTLESEYTQSKALADRFKLFNKTQEENDVTGLMTEVDTFNRLYKAAGQPPLEKDNHVRPVALIGLLPFFIFGVINFYAPYKIVSKVSSGLFKDPQFVGSMKVAIGLLLFPLYLTIITIVLMLVWSLNAGIFYFIVSLFLGILSVMFIDYKNEAIRARKTRIAMVEHSEEMAQLDNLQNEVRSKLGML